MTNKTSLLKKFLLSAEWDRAFAVVEDEDKTQNNSLTSEDYADLAYARCFQATRNHNDGNYDDVIADASKALIKDCDNIRALCIRAYGYYLNCNYDDAITDCDKIIERATDDIDKKKKQMKDAWEAACKAITAADKAQADADKAKNAAAVAANTQAAAAATAAATAKAAANKAQTDADKAQVDADKAKDDADKAAKAAADAQADYCAALQNAVFAYELLGMIYTGMDRHLGASRNYKLAMLARQSPCQQTGNPTDIAMPSPLLMDAYRNARKAVKGI